MKIALVLLTVTLADGTVAVTDQFTAKQCERIAQTLSDGGSWFSPDGRWLQVKHAKCEVQL